MNSRLEGFTAKSALREPQDAAFADSIQAAGTVAYPSHATFILLEQVASGRSGRVSDPPLPLAALPLSSTGGVLPSKIWPTGYESRISGILIEGFTAWCRGIEF